MMRKNLMQYAAILVFFGAGTISIIEIGARLHSDRAVSQEVNPTSAPASNTRAGKAEASTSTGIGHELRNNLRHPVSILLIQIIVVLAAARIVGSLMRKLGQPTVIGEMIAGILLGPSLLGWISSPTMAFLFPPDSMGALRLLSQIGVIIFMFVVGTEVNVQHIRQKAHAAVMVSHASILAPFLLGSALALVIFRTAAPAHISFTAFALFMSVAMSITAFPVLARIIEEHGAYSCVT